jgi:hypothetical protein
MVKNKNTKRVDLPWPKTAARNKPVRVKQTEAERFIAKQARRTPEQVAFEAMSTRVNDPAHIFQERMRRHQDNDFAFMRGLK